MRCPFAKGMRSRTYASFANQRRIHLSGRPLESKIPFPLTFRFLPTAQDSRISDDSSVKVRIREPCRTGINILTVCTLNFTQCPCPRSSFPTVGVPQRSHTMGRGPGRIKVENHVLYDIFHNFDCRRVLIPFFLSGSKWTAILFIYNSCSTRQEQALCSCCGCACNFLRNGSGNRLRQITVGSCSYGSYSRSRIWH